MAVRDTLARDEMFRLASIELDRAYAKHGTGVWGRHEFYAIFREEVDEVWDAIKQDAPASHLIHELSQVVAMVFRYCETGNRYGEEL